MGTDAPVHVDEKMANPGVREFDGRTSRPERAAALYLGVRPLRCSCVFGLHDFAAVADGRRRFRTGSDRADHAEFRRLGDRSPGWSQVPGKSAAGILGDGALVQDIWRARLGCETSDRALRYRALLVDSRFWRMGIRQTRGILCGTLRGHLRRSVSLHAHIDSGCHADVYGYARDLGDDAGAR